jgi:hypothetical protein
LGDPAQYSLLREVGLGNALIAGASTIDTARCVRRRPRLGRLGGLLNFYERAA